MIDLVLRARFKSSYLIHLHFYSSVLLTILLAILKSLVWVRNRKKMDFLIEYMLTDYWEIMTAHVSKHANVYAM